MARKNAKQKVVRKTGRLEPKSQVEPEKHSADAVGDAVVPQKASPAGSLDRVDPASLAVEGRSFVTRFLKAHPVGIPLLSEEPAVCWGSSGVVNFAMVSEFIGPNTAGEDAPLLFRIGVNLSVPPVLYHHLKSEAVRRKLRVATPPVIARAPVLELTAFPEEVAAFTKEDGIGTE